MINERSTPEDIHAFLIGLHQQAIEAPAELVVIPSEVRQIVGGQQKSSDGKKHWGTNPLSDLYIEASQVPKLTEEDGTLVWVGSDWVHAKVMKISAFSSDMTTDRKQDNSDLEVEVGTLKATDDKEKDRRDHGIKLQELADEIKAEAGLSDNAKVKVEKSGDRVKAKIEGLGEHRQANLKSDYVGGNEAGGNRHCFAIFYRSHRVCLLCSLLLCHRSSSQQQCFIFDPSYRPLEPALGTIKASLSGPSSQRLGRIPKLGRAYELVEQWNAHGHQVDQIWLSGDGSDEKHCRPGTAQWMQDLVLRVVAGEEMDMDGWEELQL